MATLGQQLKAAREAKGISESEAGIATHTLTKVIVAMEADDFSLMAAPTYARGFIRLYAKYLGLNPDPLIEEYTTRHAPGPKPLINEESQLEQNRHKAPAFAAGLKWLGVPARFFSKVYKLRPKKDIRAVAGGAAALLVLIILIVSLTNCVRRHVAEKSTQQPAEAPARMLLDKPLPDLYLVELGKIESSR